MAWYNKETPTPFDHPNFATIDGLFFLIGALHRAGLEGMKQAMVAFPSGEVCEVWNADDPQVHLFGGMELPLYATYTTALRQAHECAVDSWFTVFGNGRDQLELWSHEAEAIFFVTYDNAVGRMFDVVVAAA